MPADPAEGFPNDDPTVPPLIRHYAAKIDGQASPQPITPLAANLLSTQDGQLIWRGSAGASSYQIERSDDNGVTFHMIAGNVADNKPGGSVLYVDEGYSSNGSGVSRYRLYASGDGGTSPVSNLV